ncbi:hypothetical protein BsWGS_13185 [Bradybaena similaris]
MDLLTVDSDIDLLSANEADLATVACTGPGFSGEVSPVDSTIPLRDSNCSFLNVSPEEGSADSRMTIENVKHDTVALLTNDVNQNIAFNAEHNVKLDTQTSYHSKEIGIIDEVVKDEEESERADGEQLSSSLTFTNNSEKRKPGVILLGRGNSFSLGRSEVMLLHANRRNKSDAGRTGNRNYRHSVTNFDNNKNNNNAVLSFNRNVNMCDSLVAARSQQVPGSRLAPSELEALWRKAEVVMAAKQTVVQEVLEEFGIAEPGREGEETLDKVMEETIWQAVQDSLQM